MKTVRKLSKDGSALIMTMFFMIMTTSIAGVYLSYSAFDAQMARRSIDQEKVRIAAESALDFGIIKLRDMMLYHQLTLSQDGLQMLLDDVNAPAQIGTYVFEGPGGQDGFRISVDSEPISGVITQGFAATDEGNYQVFTITAGAKNPYTGNSAVLKQTLQAISLPLIRYGVFYDKDLEINPGPNMSFAGPVHCNADIYLKPEANLFFYDRVTAHGNMYRHRKDDASSGGYVGINNTNNAEVAMTIDSDNPSWMAQALSLWQGRVMSGAHGVQKLSPAISDLDTPHDIIERILPTNHPNYHIETEAEKYMNKASIIIRVASNGVLSAIDCHGSNLTYRFTNAVLVSNGSFNGMARYAKTNDLYRFLTNGAYSTTQTNFYDAREHVYLRPVDIYIDQLLKVVPELTNTAYSISEGRGLLYVTRDDPDGPTNGVRPVLRLRNAATVPVSGFSIASDLPVYIEGNYNIASNRGPTFVAGDAVTMLSVAWQDARSFSTHYSSRVAANTTYNVVIITGNTETTPGHYNGGLENVMRFLEKWDEKTVTYRGSVIDLWYSEIATGSWVYGSPIYEAPTRNYGYDTIYRTLVPPGMTHVFGLEEIQWSEGTWD
ncbi:MAG: hypothetical protein V1929_00605 [bacterium]